MSSGFTDVSLSIPIKPQRVVNEKRTAIQETVSLTGVETGSDAWGKVIPVTFGRTRVPGALIWASNFYKTTSTFQVDTEWRDRYEYNSYGSDALTFQGNDVPVGKSTTKEEITSSFIDLCYSFGKDGDTRRKRFVDKIRINEIEVFNSQTKYVAPGLGFSIRYGYDDSIDPVMAGYENGDLFYPGQTLIIFNKFPTANFGDAIPKSIDVEFGCILYDDPIPQPDNCYFFQRVIAKRIQEKVYIDNESTIEFNFVNPTMLVYHIYEPNVYSHSVAFDGFTVLAQKTIGAGTGSIIYKKLSLQDNTAYNGRVKTTVKRNGIELDNCASVVEVLEYFNAPFDNNFDPWPTNGLFGPATIEAVQSGDYAKAVAGPSYASLALLSNYPVARFTQYPYTIEGQGGAVGEGANAPGGNAGPYTAFLYSVNNPCIQIL